jgi:hypothetical protein
MAKKKKTDEGALVDAARSIGSALGTLSAKADELTTKAKNFHMPSLPSLPTAKEAKSMVSKLLAGKKKPAAKKSGPKKSGASRASAAKRKSGAGR